MTTTSESTHEAFSIRTLLLSATGGFLDGYDLAILSVALLLIIPEFNLDAIGTGALTGVAFAGMALGSIVFGSLTDKVGRKAIFIVDMALFVIGSLASGLAQDLTQLLFARFVLGLAIGMDYPAATAMLAELAPRRSRGGVSSIMQTSQFMGQAAAVGFGFLLYALGGEEAWRWMLLSGVVPAFIVLILRRNMAESRYWLDAKAKSSREESSARGTQDRLGSYVGLFRPRYRIRTLFVTAYWFLGNITGASTLLYGPTIAKEVFGLSNQGASAFQVGLDVIYVLVLAAFALWLIDRYGRKPMALIGWFGSAACFAVLFFDIESALAVAVPFIIGTTLLQTFANGTFWPWSVELFPTRMRATAQGLSSGAGKIGGLIGVFFAPILFAAWGYQYTFALICGLLLVAAILTLVFGEETRDHDLADMD